MAKEFPTADTITKDAARKLRQIADNLDTLVIDELNSASYILPRIAKVLGELSIVLDGENSLSALAYALEQADQRPRGDRF